MDFLFLTALRTVVANIFCGVLRHLLAGRAGGEVNKTTPAALPTRCQCCFEVVFLMEKKSKSMVG